MKLDQHVGRQNKSLINNCSIFCPLMISVVGFQLWEDVHRNIQICVYSFADSLLPFISCLPFTQHMFLPFKNMTLCTRTSRSPHQFIHFLCLNPNCQKYIYLYIYILHSVSSHKTKQQNIKCSVAHSGGSEQQNITPTTDQTTSFTSTTSFYINNLRNSYCDINKRNTACSLLLKLISNVPLSAAEKYALNKKLNNKEKSP